jgi:hypothetical protein
LSFPLAEALMSRHVPFVFFTAYAAIGVPSHLDRIARFLKPASYARVERTLAQRLAAPEQCEEDELVRLLPKLRIAARLLVQDAGAADRLVERALERAVASLPERDRSMQLEDWIVSIMRSTAESRRAAIHDLRIPPLMGHCGRNRGTGAAFPPRRHTGGGRC